MNHGKTFSEVMLERRVAAELGASCQIPLAVYCEFNEKLQTFNLRAKIAMPDGVNCATQNTLATILMIFLRE